MNTSSPSTILPPDATPAGAWLQRARNFLCGAPKPEQVRNLATEIEHAPMLQQWLLIAAGQRKRARHELLARAARSIAREFRDALLVRVFEEMGHRRLHEAVGEVVFRRGGLKGVARP
jgi:hypothetical protein